MMNFIKSVRKSGKRNSCFHGLSCRQHKQYKRDIEKNFFERPSDEFLSQMHMYPMSKFNFN